MTVTTSFCEPPLGTRAAFDPVMLQIEQSLAATAEQLSSLSRLLGTPGIAHKSHQSELQDLDFLLEDAKRFMQQHIISREPSAAVAEDHSLWHILRSSVHVQQHPRYLGHFYLMLHMSSARKAAKA